MSADVKYFIKNTQYLLKFEDFDVNPSELSPFVPDLSEFHRIFLMSRPLDLDNWLTKIHPGQGLIFCPKGRI